MKKKLYLFLLAALGILCGLQEVLMPKYIDSGREGALISTYYDAPKCHDVIFIGDCEVYENFSPAVLWQEYGISAFIRGSAQQTVWQSYYLAEETFRYETPRVLVFNVLALKYDTPESTGSHREAYNRMTLDGMRWSASKWRAVNASMTAEEKEHGGMLTYLFPLLRFHDRWAELTRVDFFPAREPASDNGYLMQTGIRPLESPHAAPPPADFALGQNSLQYLDRLTALCKAHGTRLVLIKSPSLYPVWWEEWDRQIEDYAARNGLVYLNFLDFQEEIGLDWSRDTYDAGLHLNVFGAEKASRWFGQLLRSRFNLPDRREDPELARIWAENIKIYRQRKESLLAAGQEQS